MQEGLGISTRPLSSFSITAFQQPNPSDTTLFFNSSKMGLMPADKKADVFCAICNCLGFFRKRDHDKLHRPSLTVLANRSFDEFSKSAKQGCCFCDVIQQSFLLLRYVDAEMRVKLLLYAQSPAELHASSNKDFPEVVEIYSCSSKLVLLRSSSERL